MSNYDWNMVVDLQEVHDLNDHYAEYTQYLEDELLDMQNGMLTSARRYAQMRGELFASRQKIIELESINEELRKLLAEQRSVRKSVSTLQTSEENNDGISYTDESVLGNTGRSIDFILENPFSSINTKGCKLAMPYEDKENTHRMGKLRRSISEPNVLDMRSLDTSESEDEDNQANDGRFTPKQNRSRFGIASSANDITRIVECSPTTPECSFTVDDIKTRRHEFAAKRNFLRDACDVCGKAFGFRSNALKCQCCKVVCHTACKEGTALPCAPRSSAALAAKGDPSKFKPRLADLCPPCSPMIPHVIIHLVTVLDNCHLHAKRIYKLKTSERLVSDLLNQLKVRKSFHQLEQNTTGILSGCVKRFLVDLRDPLIPISSANEFVRSAADESMLKQIVRELPIPNQETLQFLCLHWQRVIANRDVNAMDSRELAKALAPAVFGSPMLDRNDLVNAMEALLQLRSWREVVSYNPKPAPLTPFGSRQKSFRSRDRPPVPSRWRM